MKNTKSEEDYAVPAEQKLLAPQLKVKAMPMSQFVLKIDDSCYLTEVEFTMM
ncbi:hypothetical protein Plhal304r1_c040g0118911 [Plasmopara halstedii]